MEMHAECKVTLVLDDKDVEALNRELEYVAGLEEREKVSALRKIYMLLPNVGPYGTFKLD